MKNRKVQIDIALFLQIWRYFELDDENHVKEIREGLNRKIEALYRHELYSKYKQGNEEARKKYLDEVLMRESFRW